jgi:hypothetical protein
VRLLCIIEATPAMIAHVAKTVPAIAELVGNEWIQLATMDPIDGSIQVYTSGEFVPFEPERKPLPTVYASAHWYAGHIEHLPLAQIRAAMVDERREDVA